MKYVSITGGLGNQMFIYAFCLSLRSKGKKAILLIPRRKDSKGYGHQGYELEKLFDIQRFDGQISKFFSYFLQTYSQIIRVFPVKCRCRLFHLIGVHTVKTPENFIFYPEVFNFKNKSELFMGTWQSESFFKGAEEIVRNAFIFKESLLSKETIEIKNKIQLQNSVSIHIRRGDYLSSQYSNGFAGVCTEQYYIESFQYLKDKVESPHFYVFTDDADWVIENFRIDNATYIYHNIGKNSWQDMYLMSQCKHNIIANSSFSWWGAWLNSNPQKIIIAPKRWWRLFEKDDVVPESWVRI